MYSTIGRESVPSQQFCDDSSPFRDTALMVAQRTRLQACWPAFEIALISMLLDIANFTTALFAWCYGG